MADPAVKNNSERPPVVPARMQLTALPSIEAEKAGREVPIRLWAVLGAGISAIGFIVVLIVLLQRLSIHIDNLSAWNLPDLEIIDNSQDWGDLSVNKSVGGKELTVGKRKWMTGLGTHANSKIRLKVLNGVRMLSGMCGVDGEVVKTSGVKCIVEDGVGTKLYESQIMTDPNLPSAFSVSLVGREAIVLRVISSRSIYAAHVDWVDLHVYH